MSRGGGLAVRCPNGHEFGPTDARAATFDGDEARYQCRECGAWVEGPPPSAANMSESKQTPSEGRQNASRNLEYHLTVSRELGEALAGHYRSDPEIRSIPDALRKAGREIVDESENSE